MEKEAKKGPFAKAQQGSFQVSQWKNLRTVEPMNPFDMQREVETVRACVQYGRFNRETKKWENDVIWCYPRELNDLAQALEKLRMESDTTEISSDEASEEVSEDSQE